MIIVKRVFTLAASGLFGTFGSKPAETPATTTPAAGATTPATSAFSGLAKPAASTGTLLCHHNNILN
jgi:hypothetical protein